MNGHTAVVDRRLGPGTGTPKDARNDLKNQLNKEKETTVGKVTKSKNRKIIVGR